MSSSTTSGRASTLLFRHTRHHSTFQASKFVFPTIATAGFRSTTRPFLNTSSATPSPFAHQTPYTKTTSLGFRLTNAPQQNVHFRTFFGGILSRQTTKGEAVNTKKEEVKLHEVHPLPVRVEFQSQRLSSEELEKLDVGLGRHRVPENVGDWIAYVMVKSLRIPSDLFFRKKYLHRAVTLETVAGVPGMVAGMLRHLTSLRKMRHDGGWISHLLHEAENERMHLMIWMKATHPTWLERMLVTVVQGAFLAAYSVLYVFFPRVAHRFTAYLEEEALVSYTSFLNEIDKGNIENAPAPPLAIDYYNLPENATLRDVVLCVRADEANHRDVNHLFADRILVKKEDLRDPYKPRYLEKQNNGPNGTVENSSGSGTSMSAAHQ